MCSKPVRSSSIQVKSTALTNAGSKHDDLGVVLVILLGRQHSGEQQCCVNGGEFRSQLQTRSPFFVFTK
jgi:hypothetical protein